MQLNHSSTMLPKRRKLKHMRKEKTMTRMKSPRKKGGLKWAHEVPGHEQSFSVLGRLGESSRVSSHPNRASCHKGPLSMLVSAVQIHRAKPLCFHLILES